MEQKKMGPKEETSSNISPEIPPAYEIDFYVVCHGPIYTFHPNNQWARDYWKRNVAGRTNMGYNVDDVLAESLIQGMIANDIEVSMLAENSDKEHRPKKKIIETN
tara:strand:+ start:3141 stop:3455 length:315 start_codon:yes stop_codon:yes gene_type:complete